MNQDVEHIKIFWGTLLPGLGVMGGTFNPIHCGHLISAQEVMMKFRLDEVLFIPNRLPPHRPDDPEIIGAEHRLEMIRIGIASNPRFKASRLELDRPAISYTVDTIRILKQEFPQTEISFITGTDSLIRYQWHAFDELLEMLKYFIVVSRSGFPLESLKKKVKSLCLRQPDKIVHLPIPCLDISSTEIRKRVREGKSIRYLVPEPVEQYIMEHHLYREPSNERRKSSG